MPKILINEIDKTTPGTPDAYANYSVLIAGLQKEFTEDELTTARTNILEYNTAVEKAKEGGNVEIPTLSPNELMIKARDEKADFNGIYEFTSAQDFIDTIGPIAPHVNETYAGVYDYSHYGNQMAYELLKQGYTVIYMPVNKNSLVSTLVNEATWKIFRDKASYDFRFIHHGLLKSTSSTRVDIKNETEAELKSALEILADRGVLSFDTKDNRITSITVYTASNTGDSFGLNEVPNQTFEKYLESANAYDTLCTDITNNNNVTEAERATITKYLLKNSDGFYEPWDVAVKAIVQQLCTATAIQIVTSDTINAANKCIADLAKYVANSDSNEIPGRGDCIALIELDENCYVNTIANPELEIISAIETVNIDKDNGKYCALTVPSVIYNMSKTVVSVNGDTEITDAYNGNKKFPGGFHYLACFKNSLSSGFREWYAAAGYTRGVSSYSVRNTTVLLGEVAINALEPRAKDANGPKFACNVIANFRGSYYLWGNRTAHPLSTKASGGDLVASHFLNIRQLCTTIKKQLYVSCRRFTFDPNSDTLWFNFVNAIRPTLDEMKADQGIRDYKILKEYTDKKATLKAKIRIVPIEAVEDFDLTISLEDSFGETNAVITD